MRSVEDRIAGRVTVRVTDAVASVELDNPANRNAMTRLMCIELQELMPRLDADRGVAVVTLRGAGDTFSAGAQLGELAAVLMDPQPDGTTLDQLSRADRAIASVGKPTIALVDGACMGGGWQVASACDFIVASARSVFAITPAKIGIIYPRPGIERLVREVGPATAKLLLFSGQTVTAHRAEAIGLIAEAVPDAEFGEHCRRLVDSLRARSRFSTHHLKRLVDRTAAADPQLDVEWASAWAAMGSNPDMAIGIDAFLSRQQPSFVWSPVQTQGVNL